MGNKKNRTNHRNNHRHFYTRRRSIQKQPCQTFRKKKNLAQHTKKAPLLNGSRIINLSQLQKYINELTKHAAKCPGEITLSGDLRDRLASVIESRCGGCNHTIQFDTSLEVQGPTGYLIWECNLDAVWGQMVDMQVCYNG